MFSTHVQKKSRSWSWNRENSLYETKGEGVVYTKKTAVGHNALAKTVGCVCELVESTAIKPTISSVLLLQHTCSNLESMNNVLWTIHLTLVPKTVRISMQMGASAQMMLLQRDGGTGGLPKRRFFSNVLLTPGRLRMMQMSMMTLTSWWCSDVQEDQ